MTEEKKNSKLSNLIVRSITGVFFVTAVVVCFLDAFAMEFLFALVTGLSLWEYTGLVNEKENVQVNRFISTVAGVYFFFAVWNMIALIMYIVMGLYKEENREY